MTINEKFSSSALISLPPLAEDLRLAGTHSQEVHPCPFCGETKILTDGVQNSVSQIIAYRVFCTNRKCAVMLTAQGETPADARQKAIRRWNTRIKEQQKCL